MSTTIPVVPCRKRGRHDTINVAQHVSEACKHHIWQEYQALLFENEFFWDVCNRSLANSSTQNSTVVPGSADCRNMTIRKTFRNNYTETRSKFPRSLDLYCVIIFTFLLHVFKIYPRDAFQILYNIIQ